MPAATCRTPARLAKLGRAITEVAALHQLHHQKRRAHFRDTDVDDFHQIRVLQPGADLGLAREASGRGPAEASGHQLERQVPGIGDALDLVHRAHSPGPQLADDAIALAEDAVRLEIQLGQRDHRASQRFS